MHRLILTLWYPQSNVKGGFFMREDLGLFDAPFFGITTAEAAVSYLTPRFEIGADSGVQALDPQQRILLECCYEAFENCPLLPYLSDQAGYNLIR
jgi:acyl transferase domain-containing protein